MSERFTAKGDGKAYFIGWGYNISFISHNGCKHHHNKPTEKQQP